MRESGREGVSEERVIMFGLFVVLLVLEEDEEEEEEEEEEERGVVVVEELRFDWARASWLWETGHSSGSC